MKAALLITALGTGAAVAQDGAPIPAPLQDLLPALAQQSAWAQDVSPERPGRRGVYPVGNGYVRAYQGLGRRANTLQGITGPRYQQGTFGAVTIDLLRDGEPVAVPVQRIRRVRGAGFVVSEDATADGLALRTLTFAPPETGCILRLVQVENGTLQTVRDLAVRVSMDGGLQVSADGTAREELRAGGRRVEARYRLETGTVDHGMLRAALQLADGQSAELQPGARSKLLSFVIETIDPAAPRNCDVAAALPSARDHAQRTLDWWRTRLAKTLEVESDHARLRDLVDDWKVLVLTLRCAESGAVTSPLGPEGAGLRDQGGALLTFLRLGLWQDAAKLLRFQFDAVRRLGRIPDRLDLSLDRRDAPSRPADWWQGVQVPDGELPAWIVLQHYWYWRATGDAALIASHWPLLEVCVKKTPRGPDDLMPYAGGAAALHGGLNALFPARGDDSILVADDAPHGRRAWSHTSGVLFAQAVAALGAMQDGPDGAPLIRRSLELVLGLERQFWLADRGYFAPALSPVTMEPHTEPFAPASLMPAWLGALAGTGDKAQTNLRQSLARLWRDGARVGATPTLGCAPGATQGMLVAALTQMEGRRRGEALAALLQMAEPAGEWSRSYDADGRPLAPPKDEPSWRMDPWACGVNLDAVLYGVTGLRYVAAPSVDKDWIRLRLQLPPGASYVNLKGMAREGYRLNLFLQEVQRPLSPDELEANAEAPAGQRRDPEAEHRRLQFAVELDGADPERGYHVLNATCMGTLFQRYLQRQSPVSEMEFWQPDRAEFLPVSAPVSDVRGMPLAAAEGATMLCLSNRGATARLLGSEGVTTVDTGLPWTMAALRALLLDEAGALVHSRVYLDWGYRRVGSATFKGAGFWDRGSWQQTLERFRRAGGEVLRPGFLRAYELRAGDAWLPLRADPDGCLRLATPATVRAILRRSAAGSAFLRLASSAPVQVKVQGTVVARVPAASPLLPDSWSTPIELAAGDNVLTFRFDGPGEAELFARLTDDRGLPIGEDG